MFELRDRVKGRAFAAEVDPRSWQGRGPGRCVSTHITMLPKLQSLHHQK
jgi:hypothetical protein